MKSQDLDGYLTMSRFMSVSRKAVFDRIVSSRKSVEMMIEIGMELLEKGRVHRLMLLFECFDYFQIFYFPSNLTHSDNLRAAEHLDVTISLIGFAAQKWIQRDKWIIINEILFQSCGLNEKQHRDEFSQCDDFEEIVDQRPNNEIVIDWEVSRCLHR